MCSSESKWSATLTVQQRAVVGPPPTPWRAGPSAALPAPKSGKSLAETSAPYVDMTRVFRGNPRLLLQALPVAVAMIVLKWLYDLSPLRHLELSPLLTGVIAAEVFIVGFILSGTAADFKEAERLPGEVAGSLDSIADECLIMDAELELPEARQCLSLLADISGSIRRWLLHNEGVDDVLAALRRLNPCFIVFAPKIQAGFTTRLKGEQATIRKLVLGWTRSGARRTCRPAI